jgi:hypothetical protein
MLEVGLEGALPTAARLVLDDFYLLCKVEL